MINIPLKNINKLTLEDLKRGYRIELDASRSPSAYICIHCGERFEKGIIYQGGRHLLEAWAAAEEHIHSAHGDAFHSLLEPGENFSGFSDTQKELLILLFEGISDAETARRTGGKAESTIRHHRFQFRKRRREALLQLAVLDMLEEQRMKKNNSTESLHQFNAPLTTDDDRTIVTKGEEEKIANKYIEFSGDSEIIRLRKWPKKQKEKLVVLDRIAGLFSSESSYTEKEVNALLETLNEEYITIRRYLVDYGFFERKPGGGPYRRKTVS